MLGVVGLLGRGHAVGGGRAQAQRFLAFKVAHAQAGGAGGGADGEHGAQDADVDGAQKEVAVEGREGRENN